MSSGYDSGGIACALLDRGIDFKAYIYSGEEDQGVLEARRRLVPYENFTPDAALIPWLRDAIDNEHYTIVCDGQMLSKTVLQDGPTTGAATMAKMARADGRRGSVSRPDERQTR